MSTRPDTESAERIIAAPADKIFDLLADPTRHHEFDGSNTVRKVQRGGGRVQLGSKFTMNMKVGLPYRMESTIIEFEENRRIAWQTRPPGRIPGKLAGGRIWRYELEPIDNGTKTRVRETWDISEERVKAVVQPARKRAKQGMADTLERIERLLS